MDRLSIAHANTLLLTSMAALMLSLPQVAASQPAATASRVNARQVPDGVVGDVDLSGRSAEVKSIVDRLDFGSYKQLIVDLAWFRDRRAGTEQNRLANEWIEETLSGWGYVVERFRYDQNGDTLEQVYATNVGSTVPDEMVILGAHMDGIGGGEAANDNASGTALVMEIARVLASDSIKTDRSVRFALWNGEEAGLVGSRAYVGERAPLQGVEEPPGSGRYPEPRWIAMIQHDKVLFDHGNPVQHHQSWSADIDIEFQLVSEMSDESADLGIEMINANRMFATDYPAVLSNAMSSTDSVPFANETATVSVRENRRKYEIGWLGPSGHGARGSDPHWHQRSDLTVTYSDWDYLLGFNAAQTTLGATARLVGARRAE